MDRPGGGFRPETISNVMIALGERCELDFDLAVEAVAEVVKVTAEYTVSSGALASGRQYSTNDLRSRYQLRFGVRTSF